ncbi:FHA domain-containing protein [candidate division KSB1 bacterium]|nr:FHA domain-containing protein [candidate division KSB1 bacterium]
MPRILVKRKAEVYQEYVIPPDKKAITIGTEIGNDLVLDDKKVSLNHLELIRDERQYCIKDLRSAFGTHLNGKPIENLTPLQNGDEIQLGSHTLVFLENDATPPLKISHAKSQDTPALDFDESDFDDDATLIEREVENIRATSFTLEFEGLDAAYTPSPLTPPFQGSETPASEAQVVTPPMPFYLLAIYGPNMGKVFLLHKHETKIGRDVKLNDIIIRHDHHGKVDPSISRRHATITYQEDGFYISDKRSKTRTFVNQTKLADTDNLKLNVGDEIEIVSDQQSTIFRLCDTEKWDFSPPKKAGVWWIRYRWPILKGFSVLALLLGVILLIKGIHTRAIITQQPTNITLKESIWFKNNLGTAGATNALLPAESNFLNTPALGDLDGDQVLDVVFLDPQGRVRAISGKKQTPLWETECYIHNQMPGQLTLGDLNGNQLADILVMTKTQRLLAIDGLLGIEIWTSPIIGGRFAGSPAIADINGDGQNDLAISTREGKLIVGITRQNEIQWEFVDLNDSTQATLTAADMNTDGIDEFVIGTESGQVHIFQGKTQKITRTLDTQAEFAALTGTPGSVNGIRGPVLFGKLNPDLNLDLIISTNQGNLITLNGIDGKRIWANFSTTNSDLLTQLYLTPAIGDVDGDRADDVIMFTIDRRGIQAFKGASHSDATKIILWEYYPEDWEQFLANPVLADMNKDGILDVLAAGINRGLYILNGRNGRLLWSTNFENQNVPLTPPLVADLNQDTYLDLLVMRADKNLYQYTSTTRYPRNQIIWGQRYGNEKNRAQAVTLNLTSTPSNIQIIASLLLIVVVSLLNFYWIQRHKILFKSVTALMKKDKLKIN